MSFLKRFAENLKNNSNNDSKPPAGVNLQFSSFNQKGVGLSSQAFNLPPKPNESSKSGGLEVQPHKIGKPGGGWEDEDGDKNQFNLNKSGTSGSKFSLGGDSKAGQGFVGGDKKNSKYEDSIKTSNNIQFTKEFDLLTVEELSTKSIDYEMKLIMDLVQPAGARIKPPDSMLSEFGKASVNMPVQLISSILISNIQEDNVWIVKAKTYYVIEYLVKNFPGYQKYFKHHIMKLKNIPPPSDGNSTQLTTIKDSVARFVENPQGQEKVDIAASQQSSQENKVNLLDLGGDPSSKPPAENEKKKNAFDFIHGKKKNPEPTSSVELLGSEPVINSSDNNLISIASTQPVEITNSASQNPASKFKFINKGNAQADGAQSQANQPQVNPALLQTQTLPQQSVQNPQQAKLDAFKMFAGKDEKKKPETQQVNVGSDLMSLNFNEPAQIQAAAQKVENTKQSPAKPAVNPNLMNLYPQQPPQMYNPAMGYNPMYNPGYAQGYNNQFMPPGNYPPQMGYQPNPAYPHPMMYQNMGGYPQQNFAMGNQPGMYNLTGELNNMTIKKTASNEANNQAKAVPNEKEKAFDFIKLE